MEDFVLDDASVGSTSTQDEQEGAQAAPNGELAQVLGALKRMEASNFRHDGANSALRKSPLRDG